MCTTAVRRVILAILIVITCAVSARAQDTPTSTPTTTPTGTPTLTPTRTPTSTPTHTPNVTLVDPDTRKALKASRLSAAQKGLLNKYSPASSAADVANLFSLAVRQVRVSGVNNAALGLFDVGVVTSIMGIASNGAVTGLIEGTDYTTANGDVTILTNQTANTLVITYRP